MSLVYSSTSLEKGLKALFMESFNAEQSLAPKLCYVESSQSDKEKYEWLGQAPQMSELKGTRHVTPLSDTGYTLNNTVYTATIEVKRTDLDDNQSGSIRRRIQQMAATASAHVNKLIINALIDGTSDACYDGTAFFGNSHTARADEGGTQDNLLAGSGVTTSAIATDFAASKAAILGYKNEAGEPFHGDGAGSFAVVAPPALEKNFREVLGASMISQTSNMQAGMADLIISPRLSDANDWYMLRTDSLRGLIFQERDALEFSSLETNTESAFMREIFSYGVRARYAAGYGFWQCATKSVNS